MSDISALKVVYRDAEPADLAHIVGLLADDELGKTREKISDPPARIYVKMFETILADPNNFIIVAAAGTQVVACLQLTVIPSLTLTATARAQIEGVRVAREFRGKGLGRSLIQNVIERARKSGCGLIQLTTDKRRPKAQAFYERLGFKASHVGMKRAIDKSC